MSAMPVPPVVLEVDGAPPVRLRVAGTGDWALEQALSRVPDVAARTFLPADLTEDQARAWSRHAAERYADGVSARYVLSAGPDHVPVGVAGLASLTSPVPSVFYALLPAGRGRGTVTRAVLALTGWAHAYGYPQLDLVAVRGNTASEAVARRAGFVLVGEEWHERSGAVVGRWRSVG